MVVIIFARGIKNYVNGSVTLYCFSIEVVRFVGIERMVMVFITSQIIMVKIKVGEKLFWLDGSELVFIV